MPATFQSFLKQMCIRVNTQLGPSHAEAVYQKALHYELNCHGIHTELERHISVCYTDSQGNSHCISSERIDIYVHKDENSPFTDLCNSDIILELKATSKIPNCIEEYQLKKYLKESTKQGSMISYGVIINFPQPSAHNINENIDFKVIYNGDGGDPHNPPVSGQSGKDPHNPPV